MSRPVARAEWASGATYSSGSMAGQSPRLEPSAGEKANGALPGNLVPPRKFNFALGNATDWINYLDEQMDIAAAGALCERPAHGATITNIAASAGLVWAEGSRTRSFAVLDTSHQLVFFSGIMADAGDVDTSAAAPALAGSSSAQQLYRAGSNIWLARHSGTSGANRLTYFSTTSYAWATPSGLPNGSTIPVVVPNDTGSTILVFDGSNCYSGSISGLTAKTSPGFSPSLGVGAQTLSGSTAWVIAQGGTTTAKVSTDLGATWTTITLPTGGTIDGIEWFPRIGKFVITTDADTVGTNRAHSADGVNWTVAPTTNGPAMPGSPNASIRAPKIMDVAYGGRMIVGVRADSGNERLLYSFDGDSFFCWDRRDGGAAPLAIASDGRNQVAVLYSGGVIRMFGGG